MVVQYNETKTGGLTLGAQDFRLRLENLTTSGTVNRFVSGTGSESFSLNAGDTYAFKILDGSNISTSGLSTLELTHNGQFQVTAPITSVVPEPSAFLFVAIVACGCWVKRKLSQVWPKN